VPLDPRAIHIYTDGSCTKNPGGYGGAAAIVVYPEHLRLEPEQIVDQAFSATTNNRMELVACIKAVEWIRANKPWAGVTRAQIITDSKYVRENLGRVRYWLSYGGRNLDGEAKQNLDLWKELMRELSKVGMRVDFLWEPGKTSAVTKTVDRAAKAAAKRGWRRTDTGFRTGKISRSKVKAAATRFAANGQIATIHVYRKTAVQQDNQIRFDLIDISTGQFTGSHYAYANDSLALELHRQHSYEVTFNTDPRRPVIESIVREIVTPK
jgi:ribonuclease HI